MSEATPLEDPVAEAHRVYRAAREADVTVRLMGGIAIREHSDTATEAPFEREYRDVDFVSIHEDRKDVIELMMDLGYENNERLNQMHRFRLEFYDRVNERKADYIIDRFEFCHKWSLRHRIDEDAPTLPIEDLLLSKLQIVEISPRDLRDIIVMLHDHPVDQTPDTDAIDPRYFVDLCRTDWGLYKTTTMNLDRVDDYLDSHALPIDAEPLYAKTDRIRSAIEDGTKTWRWKLRAIIGERRKWYDQPELT